MSSLLRAMKDYCCEASPSFPLTSWERVAKSRVSAAEPGEG